MIPSSCSSSSRCARPHQGTPSSDIEYVSLSNSSSSSLPASEQQLFNLKHISALTLSKSMSVSKTHGKKGRNKSKASKPIRDGQTISKVYYPEGIHPYPALTSLEQGLTVTLASSSFAVSTSLTVPVYFGTSFALSSFNSYTGYTTLFDQYRIDEIEIWCESANQNNTIATTQVATYIDLDNATAPASFGDAADRQGAIVTNVLAGHYHRWVPHVAVAEYAGAFTSYGNLPPTWIDSSSPNVEHYGFKLATNGVDGVVRNIQITFRAKISFRSSAI